MGCGCAEYRISNDASFVFEADIVQSPMECSIYAIRMQDTALWGGQKPRAFILKLLFYRQVIVHMLNYGGRKGDEPVFPELCFFYI